MERLEFSDAEFDELMRRERGGDEAAARVLDDYMEHMLQEIIGDHEIGGRYWDRTSDFHRVKVALYR